MPGFRRRVAAVVKRTGYIPVMCGRFTARMTWAEIVALYRLTRDRPPHNLPPHYNI
jgi:hypothetical protein